MSTHHNIKLGITFSVISSLSFALMSVLVKMIGHSLPSSMILFFRFLISLVLLLPWLLLDTSFSLKVTKPLLFLIRSIAPLLALACLFYIINYMPLVDALLLNNTTPLFVPLAALVISKVKTPKKVWLGVVIGFIGVIIVLNPGAAVLQIVSLLGLASGLFGAIAIVLIRVLSKTHGTKQMMFYYFLISTVVLLPFVIWKWQMPHHRQLWLLLLGVGIFGALYQWFATLAYRSAPVRLLSPLIFLTTLFGGIFDWLIWQQIPNRNVIFGALVIIAGVLISIYFGKKDSAIMPIIHRK